MSKKVRLKSYWAKISFSASGLVRSAQAHADRVFDKTARDDFVLLLKDLNDVFWKWRCFVSGRKMDKLFNVNSLMMEFKISSSSGGYLGLLSSGMRALSNFSSPNTNPARRTLYNAGLSQKILKMSSFLTKTRLPLCNAIIPGLAWCVRTAITCFFRVP